jgi:chromate transporter
MSDTSAVPAPSDPPEVPRIGPLRLLVIWTQITIVGFGGVAPYAYSALVERRRLISNAEFTEAFAFGQILPGPAVANLAVIVGYRDSGALGAAAALTGLVTLPLIMIVLVGIFYGQYAHLPAVRDGIIGMATVTGGLIVAMALKMSRGTHKSLKRLSLLVAGFVAFGLLRLPILLVIGMLAPLAVWMAWREGE